MKRNAVNVEELMIVVITVAKSYAYLVRQVLRGSARFVTELSEII